MPGKTNERNGPDFVFAEQFIGVPYVASTLEVNPDEELVVNLRQLDCTTLVENVVALTLTVREEHPTFVSFCRNLEKYVTAEDS